MLLSAMARSEELSAEVERLTKALADLRRTAPEDDGDGDGADCDPEFGCSGGAGACGNCALAASEIADLTTALEAATEGHREAVAARTAAEARTATFDGDMLAVTTARDAAQSEAARLGAELAALRGAHGELVAMQAAEARARAASDEQERETSTRTLERLKTAETDSMTAKAALAMLQTQFEQAQRAWAATEADMQARLDAGQNTVAQLRDEAGRSLRLAREEAAGVLAAARAETERVREEKAAVEAAAGAQEKLHDAAVSKMQMYKAKAHSDQLRFEEKFIEYEREKEALEAQLRFALGDRTRLEEQLNARSAGGAAGAGARPGSAATPRAGAHSTVGAAVRGRTPVSTAARARAPSATPSATASSASLMGPPAAASSARALSRTSRVAAVANAAATTAAPAVAPLSAAGAGASANAALARTATGAVTRPTIGGAGARTVGTPTAAGARARLSVSASATALLGAGAGAGSARLGAFGAATPTAAEARAQAAAATQQRAAAAAQQRATAAAGKIVDPVVASSPFFSAVSVEIAADNKENTA